MSKDNKKEVIIENLKIFKVLFWVGLASSGVLIPLRAVGWINIGLLDTLVPLFVCGTMIKSVTLDIYTLCTVCIKEFGSDKEYKGIVNNHKDIFVVASVIDIITAICVVIIVCSTGEYRGVGVPITLYMIINSVTCFYIAFRSRRCSDITSFLGKRFKIK